MLRLFASVPLVPRLMAPRLVAPRPAVFASVRRALSNGPAPTATKVSVWRRLSSAAAAVEDAYPRSLQALHWTIAAGVLTCIGTVKVAQNTKGATKVREGFNG